MDDIKRPITVEFNYYNEHNEFSADTNLTFRTTDPMTLGELKNFCKRFAYALSFDASAIEEVFGPDGEDRIQRIGRVV